MKLVNVAERPDLMKDLDTGSIFVVDDTEKKRYKEQRARFEKQKELKDDVDQLKNDIDDIKSMLTTLINK
jgi:KaiC/GvpD/RAD55 family RecA-like ATPase